MAGWEWHLVAPALHGRGHDAVGREAQVDLTPRTSEDVMIAGDTLIDLGGLEIPGELGCRRASRSSRSSPG
jgi:hypothetical protein